MSERLQNWIRIQQKLVCDGVKASHLRLDGPDEGTWGTWPIGTKNLADIIQQQLRDWAEQMPKGNHSARLVALDGQGQQTALFPLTIHGNNAAAKSPGNEAILHARANAMSVSTAERQLEAMSARVVQAEERLLGMFGSVIELGSTIATMQRQAVDDEVRRVETAARADSMVRLADGFAKHAEPLVALLTAHLADKLEERQQRKKEEECRAQSSESDSGARSDGPEPTPPNGGGNSKGGSRRPAKRSRKRAAPRTTTSNNG